jgi:ElaB/YqjD/DUF883 family membrane-anchored ribosome-binding protein
MTDETSETDRIEHELAQTRARMDSRLGELQDHLTPKQMLNDAFAYFRGGDGGDFANDLIARAKANPIPVALAGIGIAWLMASSSDSYKGDRPAKPRDDLETRIRAAEGNVGRFDNDDDDSYAGRLDDARGKVVGVTRNASDTATSYAQRIKDAIASAGQNLRDKSHDLSASAGSAFNYLGDGATQRGAALQKGSKDMARTARETFSSVSGNPLALGAVAALVGLVAGSLIPTSSKEEEKLGSMATKLRTAGHDLAQDVVDRGGRIANDTIDAVKSSAEAHGLSAERPVGELLGDVMHGDLVGNIKQVAQETVGAAKESVHTHIAQQSQTEDVPQNG